MITLYISALIIGYENTNSQKKKFRYLQLSETERTVEYTHLPLALADDQVYNIFKNFKLY